MTKGVSVNRHRRRPTRPSIALATGLSVAALLGACGGSDDTGGESEGGDSLTMWTFKQSHVEALENAATAFEEETGVSVSIQAITPDDVFQQRVQASASTGDLPDVMEVHAKGEDFIFGAAGIVDDLTDDITDEWAGQYSESISEDGTVTADYYELSQQEGSNYAGVEEGQRFSVPFTVGTFGIVYANAERLAAAGITEAPATWEQFIADLETVQAADPESGTIGLGFKEPSTGLNWIMQPMAYHLFGRDDFEALYSDDRNVNWASANGLRALEVYDQLTPYWQPGVQTLGIDEADIAFANGESTYLVGGTFTLAFLSQNGYDTENLITFPVPPPEGSVHPQAQLAPLTLTGLSISSSSENPEAAREWVQFLSQPDVATQFAQDALDLPPVDMGDDPSSSVGPVLGAMIESFGTGDDAFNPGDTTYQPGGFQLSDFGAVLVNLSPLGETDAPTTADEMATLLDAYWSGS